MLSVRVDNQALHSEHPPSSWMMSTRTNSQMRSLDSMGMDKTDGTLDLVGSGDATGAGMTVSDADG